jgi:hypothetical protein
MRGPPADLGTLVFGAGTTGGISVSPVNAFLNWWDGNELWLSGLAFVLQAMIVMPVVLAVAYITAAVLDGLLGRGIELMRRVRRANGAPG